MNGLVGVCLGHKPPPPLNPGSSRVQIDQANIISVQFLSQFIANKFSTSYTVTVTRLKRTTKRGMGTSNCVVGLH